MFTQAYRYRRDGMPQTLKVKIAGALSMNAEEVGALALGIVALIDYAVYEQCSAQEVLAVLPADFDMELSRLIAAVVGSHVPAWSELAKEATISLPKLVDVDWRVDVKTASDAAFRMAEPTVIVEMSVQEAATRAGVMLGVRRVNFEMSKETLATMLDGLGKIRDQLASIKTMQGSE